MVPATDVLPGPWYITVTNLPVWSQNVLSFSLLLTIEDNYPCPDDCSGNGVCGHDGKCVCGVAWGDKDCSVPMTVLPLDQVR